MPYTINIDNENCITVNNKQLIPSNWKPSELRPILVHFDLNPDGSLNTLLETLHNYIQKDIESDEKEIDDGLYESYIYEKSINTALAINEYVSNNGLKICEFVAANSIVDFIDMFSE